MVSFRGLVKPVTGGSPRVTHDDYGAHGAGFLRRHRRRLQNAEAIWRAFARRSSSPRGARLRARYTVVEVLFRRGLPTYAADNSFAYSAFLSFLC